MSADFLLGVLAGIQLSIAVYVIADLLITPKENADDRRN